MLWPMRRLLIGLGLVVLGCIGVGVGFAPAASAHHGGTGDYDASRPLYLSGTVTATKYGFPHAVLDIQVPAGLTAPDNLTGLDQLRGNEFWNGDPIAYGAGQRQELLLPPDITGTIGGMDNRPARGDTVRAIAYQRCAGDDYAGELRVQQISFAGEQLRYEGTITRMTDGCPDEAEHEEHPEESTAPSTQPDGSRTEAAPRTDDNALDRTLHAVEDTPVAETVRAAPRLYPGLESAHIVGIAILVGAAAMFDLRLLGAAKQVPVASAARQLLPWTWAGLGVVAVTGLLMFSANASGLAENPALQLKLALIALAGLNALAFQLGPYRSIAKWTGRIPARAKVSAVASLLVWAAIIACGRLIAYV
jgi:hypothetical protein